MNNQSVIQKLRLHSDDTEYQTLLSQKFLKRKKWQPKNEDQIRSVIPGSTTQIFVQKGEKIQKGTPMFKYEAMKMENTVCAPTNCTIKQLHIQVNEAFPKDKILLELTN